MQCDVIRTLIAIALVFSQSVFCADFLWGSYIKKLTSCSLAAVSRQNVTESEMRCKYACVHDDENCVAYQWDAASGSCKMQDKLHIKGSAAAEDVVGVMTGDEDSQVTCATDCADILAADPTSESGVYLILAAGQFRSVWCDMDTDGGGWTVFLKRLDGSVDFYQDRAAYKAGFGDVSGEYWLGLDVLHAMTSSKTYKLRADVSDWAGASVHSLHESMVVADDTEQYTLTIGSFLGGEGGDCLPEHQGMKFSTKELDLDVFSDHCAVKHHGGFWYRQCAICHPTAKYYTGGAYTNTVNDGVQWRTWIAHNDNRYSMKTVDMKIRP